MNPRQRRGVLLLVLAGVGAVLVFALVSGYVSDVREQVEPKTSVLVLRRDAAPYEQIPAEAIARREVPVAFVPRRALRDSIAVGTRVPATALPAGTVLQEGMLVDAPALQAGEQEVSILINADTGVAGKIRPDDRVDVNATFAGDDRSVPTARKMITAARVVTIGLPRPAGTQPFSQDQAAGAAQAATEVVPVTFALKPRDVLRLQYAETFAQGIRLSLVAPGDETELKAEDRQYSLPRSREVPPPR